MWKILKKTQMLPEPECPHKKTPEEPAANKKI